MQAPVAFEQVWPGQQLPSLEHWQSPVVLQSGGGNGFGPLQAPGVAQVAGGGSMDVCWPQAASTTTSMNGTQPFERIPTR
jgi:hypothetical protein